MSQHRCEYKFDNGLELRPKSQNIQLLFLPCLSRQFSLARAFYLNIAFLSSKIDWTWLFWQIFTSRSSSVSDSITTPLFLTRQQSSNDDLDITTTETHVESRLFWDLSIQSYDLCSYLSSYNVHWWYGSLSKPSISKYWESLIFV